MRLLASVYASFLLVFMNACGSTEPSEEMGINSVERVYNVSALDAIEGAAAAATDLNLKVESRHADALGGALKARRVDGTDVSVFVKGTDIHQSRVTVKVGEGDLAMANRVHAQMSENLKPIEARNKAGKPDSPEAKAAERAPRPEGAAYENRYNYSMKDCEAAAKSALATLGIPISSERRTESLLSLNAQKGSAPIVISFRRMEDRATMARFVVGNQRSGENDQLLQQIKREYESALAANAPTQQ